MQSKFLTRLYDIAVFILVVLILVVVPVEMPVIDDSFIYFNYARNFAEGRPFAYDPRNIPSEGFTSILFMLMLVPPTHLGINPLFASALFNILALALSIVWLTQAVRSTVTLTPLFATMFPLFLTAGILSDSNIRSLVFSGFEAVFGLLWVTGMIISVLYALDRNRLKQSRYRWVIVLSIITIVAHFVRPEYLILGVASIIILALFFPDKRFIFKAMMLLIVITALYYLVKILTFGDIFPTGFYRKVRTTGIGFDHIMNWASSYFFIILLSVITIIRMTLEKKLPIIVPVALCYLVLILLFYMQATPLMHLKFRFLIVPIWVLYVTISIGISISLNSMAPYFKRTHLSYVNTTILIMLILVSTSIAVNAKIDLDQRAQKTIQNHVYMPLVIPWRERLTDPDKITVVHGEAGVFNYVLGTRYIDPYGLAEPSIAHLFRMPDSKNKTDRFVQIILENKPDVVIDYHWNGFVVDLVPIVIAPTNAHSPFQSQIPAAVYEAYRDYGMIYGCTVRGFHVLLWRESPYGVENLRKIFCSHPDALYFADGLIVMSEGRSVYFPPIAEIPERRP